MVIYIFGKLKTKKFHLGFYTKTPIFTKALGLRKMENMQFLRCGIK